jgi:hypothetical protein
MAATSHCRKCGVPIAFKRLPSGKLMPVNPDGSSHWDACKQAQRAGKPIAAKPAAVTEGRHTQFYTGSVPPWHESLGPFKCFEGCCP